MGKNHPQFTFFKFEKINQIGYMFVFYRLHENDRDKFLKRLKHISKNHNIQSEPNTKYETLRRRLFHNVHELWYYINSQTAQFNKDSKKSPAKRKLTSFMNMIGEFKR